MHAEEDRPRYVSTGLVNQMECCDGQIESGYRDPAECEPRCPWQRVTPWSARVWRLFAFCAGRTAATETEPERYYIDPTRWEAGLRTFAVPGREWETAWEWMHFICDTVNHPDRDVPDDGRRETGEEAD